MDSFLDKDNIVSDMFSFDEAALIIRNYRRENGFDSIGDNFYDDLATNITQRDWSESVEGGGSFFFGDES